MSACHITSCPTCACTFLKMYQLALFMDPVFCPKQKHLCKFVLVSAGLPRKECKPCKGRRGQAEGQVPWSGPEARRLRLSHEETTEGGRWLRFVHDLDEHKKSGEAGLCLIKNRSQIWSLQIQKCPEDIPAHTWTVEESVSVIWFSWLTTVKSSDNIPLLHAFLSSVHRLPHMDVIFSSQPKSLGFCQELPFCSLFKNHLGLIC